MTSNEPSPPRWAEAMLLSLLRPADRESIAGDLLEEYRAARRPSLGALRANAWYVKHALSMLWHLIRPYALVLVGPSIVLALTVFRPGHHAIHHAPVTRPMLLSLMAGAWGMAALRELLASRCSTLWSISGPAGTGFNGLV